MKIIDRLDIKDAIFNVAKKINEKYSEKEIILVGILDGCVVFLADLIRELTCPLAIYFVQASSYDGIKSGKLKLNFDSLPDLNDKHVLIIDDIFDTGKTLLSVIEHIENMQPKSIESIVILNKLVNKNFSPTYSLFEIEMNDFVVGYGMDYNEKFRNLPDIEILS